MVYKLHSIVYLRTCLPVAQIIDNFEVKNHIPCGLPAIFEEMARRSLLARKQGKS